MTERLAVDVAEAAELVCVSRRLVEALIARRQFPHARLGNRIVVPLRALDEWLTASGLASTLNEHADTNGLCVDVRQREASASGRRRSTEA